LITSLNNCVYFRENGLARFYYLWVNQFEFSKEYRMNERMVSTVTNLIYEYSLMTKLKKLYIISEIHLFIMRKKM
jgi:hypothetical protein